MAPAPIEGSWSDRKLAAGRKFTGIGIKLDQSGNSIARIRIRYGDVWTDWRETTSRANAGKEETLELDKDKDIENISGYSYDKSAPFGPCKQRAQRATSASYCPATVGDHMETTHPLLEEAFDLPPIHRAMD